MAPEAMLALEEQKYNQNHDPENGQFTFSMGHGAAGNGAKPVRRGIMKPVKQPTPSATPSPRVRRARHPGFSENIIAAAKDSHRRTGIPASITLAQFALESGYGKHMPRGSNNPFGIKAKPGEPFVLADTWEQDRSGRKFVIKAKFRKYNSVSEAFTDHARLLNQPVYAHARRAGSSDEFADRLTGVYATDRKYGEKLKAVIRHNDLDSLNTR